MLLGKLAQSIGAAVEGDENIEITGIAPLATANKTQIAFIARKAFIDQLSTTSAAAVILTREVADGSEYVGNKLISDNPYLAYAKATRFFDPFPSKTEAFIHPSATVASSATIGERVYIGANTVIEDHVVVGDETQIGSGCFIGQGTTLGKNCLLHSNVSVYHGVDIGDRVILHSFVVIGADGFGFAPSSEGWVKIHQLGGVSVGDDVEIGSGTAVDRGALGDTVLEDGVKLDNHVHIAHNVSIGKNTAFAAMSGVAGSTKIGANCTVAGMVGFAGHLTIVDNAHFTGKTMVSSDVLEPGVYSSGVPLQPANVWRKNAIRLGKLDEYVRVLNRLAKKLND